MKVILSRKGFDSGSGGYPSLILPDGTLLSLPIPGKNDPHTYDNLNYKGVSYGKIIEDLRINNLNRFSNCHLDPDIYKNIIRRESKWKGVFGQAGSSQRHLEKYDIGKGDIFLFFGWFKEVSLRNGCYSYIKNAPDLHIIYGYLQIDNIICLNQNLNLFNNEFKWPKWLDYHPHIKRNSKINSIYLSSDKLSINNKLKGYGTLKLNTHNILTSKGKNRTIWNLPELLV